MRYKRRLQWSRRQVPWLGAIIEDKAKCNNTYHSQPIKAGMSLQTCELFSTLKTIQFPRKKTNKFTLRRFHELWRAPVTAASSDPTVPRTQGRSLSSRLQVTLTRVAKYMCMPPQIRIRWPPKWPPPLPPSRCLALRGQVRTVNRANTTQTHAKTRRPGKKPNNNH
jgi:hypothetical protein